MQICHQRLSPPGRFAAPGSSCSGDTEHPIPRAVGNSVAGPAWLEMSLRR